MEFRTMEMSCFMQDSTKFREIITETLPISDSLRWRMMFEYLGMNLVLSTSKKSESH